MRGGGGGVPVIKIAMKWDGNAVLTLPTRSRKITSILLPLITVPQENVDFTKLSILTLIKHFLFISTWEHCSRIEKAFDSCMKGPGLYPRTRCFICICHSQPRCIINDYLVIMR